MSVYFLSVDFDADKGAVIERRIRTAIPDLVKIGSFEEISLNALPEANHQNYLLLLAPTRNSADFAKIIEILSRHRDHLFSILISEDISATDYKKIIRTGHVDWVSAAADPQEIFDIISKQTSGIEPRAPHRASPVILSFVPSAGGVGNTTLTVEMSTHLKTQKATAQRRICLVDLDFQNSHVCDCLDIEPRLQINEISSNPERLDDQLFNIYVSSHSSGLDVLAAPRTKFQFCDLNILALDKLFDMISTRYDLVVIDLPPVWFAWTFQVIAVSDGVVVTGINTIPGIRQMVETTVAVRKACRTSCRVAVAVNRCEHHFIGGIARRHHVEKVLGHERIFYVRDDSMVIQSVNTGTPLAISSPARKASREMIALGAFFSDLKSSAPGPTM